MIINKQQMCSPRDFAKILCELQDQQFDGFVCVAGSRGKGKSCFTRIVLKEYCDITKIPFDLQKFTYYSRRQFDNDIETNEERQIFFGDEAVTLFFNREWNDESQIDIVKKLNICRYKKHLIFALSPIFSSLDKGVRDLVPIYVWVQSRPMNGQNGYAHIFMKNDLPFMKDAWSVNTNERLGHRYLRSGNYHGTIVIPDYSKENWFIEMEELAAKIKDEKKKIEKEESSKPDLRKSKKSIYPLLNYLRREDNNLLVNGWREKVADYLGIKVSVLAAELYQYSIDGKERNLENSNIYGDEEEEQNISGGS